MALKKASNRIFLELCPDEETRRDWQRIEEAFIGRYASITRQKEASAMLRKLTLSSYERDYPEDRAILSTLIAQIVD